MHEFYSKLSDFRKSSILSDKSSPFLKKSFKLYILLMTAQSEISSEEETQVLEFQGEDWTSSEELLHKMWFFNAWARYLLYIKKDNESALKLTKKNIQTGHELLLHNFLEDDKEKKNIIFILALNIVRISFYKNELQTCKLQIQALKSLIFQKRAIKKDIFDEDLTKLLNHNGLPLINNMSEDDFAYYRLKFSLMESKLLNNLLEAFDHHLQDKATDVAFIDYDINKSYTWEMLNRIAIACSCKIPGEVKYTLICTEQNILFPAALLACWQSETIPVMVHENYTIHELEQIKKNFQNHKTAVLIDEKLEKKIATKYEEIFGNVIIFNEDEIENKILVNEKRSVHSKTMALGLITSGSSGPPKLCLFSHENLIQASRIESYNEPVYQGGVIANLRPHYTSAGLNSLWPAFLVGTTIAFSEKIRKTPMVRFLNELIEKINPSLLILSPTYLISLFQDSKDGPVVQYKLPLYFGGSSLPWNLLEKLMHNNFIPAMRYGMTEVAHIISRKNFDLNQTDYNKSDVGIPFKNVRICIKDGMVEVYGPGIISKIIDQGVETTITTQKFLTSDKAELSADGSILLEGRDNRTININGFRFNSQQVEEVLSECKNILDCRVLGIGDHQKLCAFILINKSVVPTVEIESELKTLAKRKLSHFKQPSSYYFLNEWPVSTNGKIDFNKLKDLV